MKNNKEVLEILDDREKQCEDHLAYLDEIESSDRKAERIASILVVIVVSAGVVGGIIAWLTSWIK